MLQRLKSFFARLLMRRITLDLWERDLKRREEAVAWSERELERDRADTRAEGEAMLAEIQSAIDHNLLVAVGAAGPLFSDEDTRAAILKTLETEDVEN